MSQVSRRPINEESLEKIFNIFLSSFIKIRDKQTATDFFEEFLTPTEKIMLAKRIACLYLLLSNTPAGDINDLLKMSEATIYKYRLLINKNSSLAKILKDIKMHKDFRLLIETIIEEIIDSPTRPGKNWSTALKNKYQRDQEKASPL